MGVTHSVWRTIQLPVHMIFSHISPSHAPLPCLSRSVCVLMAQYVPHTRTIKVPLAKLTLIFPVPRKASLLYGEACTPESRSPKHECNKDNLPYKRAVMLVGKDVLEPSGQLSPNADPIIPPACIAMTDKSNKFLTALHCLQQDERVS